MLDSPADDSRRQGGNVSKVPCIFCQRSINHSVHIVRGMRWWAHWCKGLGGLAARRERRLCGESARWDNAGRGIGLDGRHVAWGATGAQPGLQHAPILSPLHGCS